MCATCVLPSHIFWTPVFTVGYNEGGRTAPAGVISYVRDSGQTWIFFIVFCSTFLFHVVLVFVWIARKGSTTHVIYFPFSSSTFFFYSKLMLKTREIILEIFSRATTYTLYHTSTAGLLLGFRKPDRNSKSRPILQRYDTILAEGVKGFRGSRPHMRYSSTAVT